MNTLTKVETAKAIADATGITEAQALEAVQTTLTSIEAALIRGDRVEFRGFGVFEVVTRKARLGWLMRNRYQTKKQVPNAAKQITLPAKKVVKFWFTSKADLC